MGLQKGQVGDEPAMSDPDEARFYSDRPLPPELEHNPGVDETPTGLPPVTDAEKVKEEPKQAEKPATPRSSSRS